MKLLFILIIAASLHTTVVEPPVIFTVESSEQSFHFAVRGGKIVPYSGCLFPGPFGSFSPIWNNWHEIRSYFEKEGYSVHPMNSK